MIRVDCWQFLNQFKDFVIGVSIQSFYDRLINGEATVHFYLCNKMDNYVISNLYFKLY